MVTASPHFSPSVQAFMATTPQANPLDWSRWLLNLAKVQVSVTGRDRLPDHLPLVLVSNHRSVMDAPLLMQAVNRPIRFACHHYMEQVPGLREMIKALNCLPLDAPGSSQTRFFRRALKALEAQESVGIFPEGATPMVQPTSPSHLSHFHHGFAHLALRAPVEELAIVPVAIISQREVNGPMVPLRWLSWFDDTEPLFQQPGWHPAVVYRRVELRIGHPVRVDSRLRSRYRRKGSGSVVAEMANCCHNEIATLLRGRGS
jgi:1-acyl-sn-glycerol-3-phosphate acyltransferase